MMDIFNCCIILAHSDALNDLEESRSTDDKHEEGYQPWSHRVFVLAIFRALGHIAANDDILGGLVVGHSHALGLGHG